MNWSFSVSSCNKRLLQKGIICLNLVRIWYIFPTHTFVLNAVKEPGPGIFSMITKMTVNLAVGNSDSRQKEFKSTSLPNQVRVRLFGLICHHVAC